MMQHIRQYQIFFSLAFLTLFFATTVKGISSHTCLTQLKNSIEITKGDVHCPIDVISCCDNDNPDCCITDVQLLEADSYTTSSDIVSSNWVQVVSEFNAIIEHNYNTSNFTLLTENEEPPDVPIYIRHQAFLC